MRLLNVMFLALLASSLKAQSDLNLRLNQIQVIGTHNSYHAGLTPSIRAWLQSKNPKAASSLDYQHAPLEAQFDSGVRQVELDVFYDPDGGRYAKPASNAWVTKAGLPPDPPDGSEQDMRKPGFKVMHVQDLDQRSTCTRFVTCLEQVREWSRAHPDHIPIFILVETKQGSVKGLPGAQEALPFTPQAFSALETEILSVFRREELLTPDKVRGTRQTLPEAIAAGGWPTLKQAQGKIVFLLDQRANEPVYTDGHPALQGRLMFTNAKPGAPDAAFTEENDAPVAEINVLVHQGYLVRTRTDSDTVQARTNDVTRRDAVLASGAQLLSTDYPGSEPARWTGYSVALPGKAVARCNPVLTPPSCVLGER